jgi:cell division septum initiation protein DivIVA
MNTENLDEKVEENENLEKRIEDILGDIKEGGLTKDSIAMVICLEDEIDSLEKQINLAESTITLIKSKKVFATYEGDRDKPYDLDQFALARNLE